MEIAENQIINGEAEYTAAIDNVLVQAQQRLRIFDQDLRTGGWQSIARAQALREFIAQPGHQLTLILHHAEYFQQHCPRLQELLRLYAHQFRIFITNAHAKIATDNFILADEHAYLRRFHIDQPRFRYVLNDVNTTAELGNRFEELLAETEYPLTATVLGL